MANLGAHQQVNFVLQAGEKWHHQIALNKVHASHLQKSLVVIPAVI